MGEMDIVKWVVEAFVVIVVVIVFGSILSGVLDSAIETYRGTMYEGSFVALALITGIPTTIIAVAVGLIKKCSE